MSHRFTTNLDEDDYGDLILTIPYEICEELGWNVQTELQFELGDEGNRLNISYNFRRNHTVYVYKMNF